jgi:hypothetical protein
MPLICYTPKDFRQDTLSTIEKANDIIDEFAAQGFDLTLRQLYYQFVSRGLIANTDREYKRLGSVVNDGRLAGLIDWERITDRTRFVRSLAHWESPSEIVGACVDQYRLDKWKRQPTRVEVWVEKDALVGVIEGVCKSNDVSFISCRGYVSQSEMWSASQRLLGYIKEGQRVVVLHLGDHDPSGIDMSRDIRDRLGLFLEHEGSSDQLDLEIRRIALTMAQVKTYSPPPNPAKLTDARAKGYVKKFGRESWELDALSPATLAELISAHILGERDDAKWEDDENDEDKDRDRLREVVYSLSDGQDE